MTHPNIRIHAVIPQCLLCLHLSEQQSKHHTSLRSRVILLTHFPVPTSFVGPGALAASFAAITLSIPMAQQLDSAND